MSVEGLRPNELKWLDTIGKIIEWGPGDFITARDFVTTDMTIRQLEGLRALHIGDIKTGRMEMPYLKEPWELYMEVNTFRATHFMTDLSAQERAKLDPDSQVQMDKLMDFATATAFATVSGILSGTEVAALFRGEEISAKLPR